MFASRPPPSSSTLFIPPSTSPSSLLSAFRAAARSPSTCTHSIVIARAFAAAHRHVVASAETSCADSCGRLWKAVMANAEYHAPNELQVAAAVVCIQICCICHMPWFDSCVRTMHMLFCYFVVVHVTCAPRTPHDQHTFHFLTLLRSPTMPSSAKRHLTAPGLHSST